MNSNYGLNHISQKIWAKVPRATDVVIQSARRSEPINYLTVMEKVGGVGRGKEISDLMEALSTVSYRMFGIFLSAIVVYSGEQFPNGDFLGIEGIQTKYLRKRFHFHDPLTPDEKDFISGEQAKVYEWGKLLGSFPKRVALTTGA